MLMFNHSHIALNILILFSFVLTASAKGIASAKAGLPDPRREVISIYNDNFTTPMSRVPYFIEVYRCVETDNNCGSKEYPVPSKKTEIEIVVPDLTNSYRDPLKEKFYKYVAYNHTSCKCGKYEEWKLYEEIQDIKVSKDDFNYKYKKNPPNLLGQCNYCNSPQPRYKLHPDHQEAFPEFKYLVYKQCLPGCVVTSIKPFNKSTSMQNGNSLSVSLTNDTSCVAYDHDAPSLQNPSCNSHAYSASNPFSHSTLRPSNLQSHKGHDAPSLQNPSSNSHAYSASNPFSHSTLRPSNLQSHKGHFNKENASHEINVGFVHIGSPKLILAAFLPLLLVL